jgi:hypothetical protein
MTKRVLPLLLLVAAAAPAAAQRRASLDVAAARLQAAPSAASPSLAAEAEEAGVTRRAASAPRRAMAVLGGAVLGAGAGYLASQVAWSDWDKSSNSEFKERRLSFTLGGSAVGALTGLLLGRRMDAPAGMQPGTPGRPLASAGSVVTEEEIRASTASNLYELLQALRPHWLRNRGPTGNTEVNVDQQGVRVYVERGLVGDLNALRQITPREATTIEFLDAAAATYRLGQGNPSGAIVVHTGRPRT